MEANILRNLNKEQLEAVESIEGYIRVIAGAGSGKTRALSHRFAFLVNEIGILPSNIMCVTFTNKSANEMKKRIRKLIRDSDCGYVCTFHGFCVSLLKEDGHYINYPQSFVILDSEDTDSILKEVYEEQGFSLKQASFSAARDFIGLCKSKSIPDYYEYLISKDNNKLLEMYNRNQSVMEKIFWGYLYHQKRIFALDYDDLIILALYILRSSKEIRTKWQQRLEYIMVDEFQDIDGRQHLLMEILCQYHNNLFVVGDPDQTIYTWRGANINYINNFDRNFPNVTTLKLNRNYRSTPNILNVSNSLIKHNRNRIPNELISMNNNGITAVYNHSKTNALESEWIATQVKDLVSQGHKLGDIAVLYRAHYLSRSVEEAFIKNKIKYTLFSGVQFYCRSEIKDTLSYMRLIAYKDDLSFKRIINVPKRNIGKAKMEILTEYAQQNNCSLYQALADNADSDSFKRTKAVEFVKLIEKYSAEYTHLSLIELVSRLLNDSGYEEYLRTDGEQERLDNLAELKKSIEDFERSFGEDVTLDDYLSRIALYTNADLDNSSDTVKMMTIHTAKGLEFPFVFVCGLNEGTFPSKRIETREQLEEERRLAYVAFTRAEQGLFLTDSEGTNFDGSYRYPSRFIFNIDKQFLNYTVELDEHLIEEASFEIEQNERDLDFDINNLPFGSGDRIKHRVLGTGTIIEVDREKMVYIIKFDKLATERRIHVKTALEKEGN